MYVKQLKCPKCCQLFDHKVIQQLCNCGSPLLVEYDFAAIDQAVTKARIQHRLPTLWRYKELLPVTNVENRICLGEGMTPLLNAHKLAEQFSFGQLWIKDEGMIPTGSFKARGAAVGVSKAKELGVKTLAMPTNGNAGAAWAAYCAAADIKAKMVAPATAPEITFKEAQIYGADVFLVNGLISDAGKIVTSSISKRGWYDASSLKEPYRIEGKKTMGLEIAEQLNWQMPDVILYPTGGGVGLIGIYKALNELKALAWVSGKLPRLVAVQATGCAPIVRAWQEHKKESEFFDNAQTCAFGITVPKALGDFLVLEAIYATEGCAVAVDDVDILAKQQKIAKTEGLFVCPEGAATLAAAVKLRESNWIKAKDSVVLLNTGAGIKYPETVDFSHKIIQLGAVL